MIKNKTLKNSISCILVLLISVLLIPVISSCLPDLKFGDLTICEQIDKESGEATKPKDEFNINVSKIYATIYASGVKADDNKRFTVRNKETGTIVFDITDKYSLKDKGYIEGNFYIETEDKQEDMVLLAPGKYTVDFYHKGELIDSADFRITAPDVRVIDVTLANEVNDDSEPVNTTREFNPTDTVWVCIKLDYHITGTALSAKWYTEQDEPITDTEYEITNDYYSNSYISFNLKSDDVLPAGKYYVEVYLNDSIEGKYDFEVIGEEIATPEINFSQNNIYTNDSYKYSILYPDGWTYKEAEDETGINTQFLPIESNIPASISIFILNEGNFNADQLEELADSIVTDIMTSNTLVQRDKMPSSGELLGFPYEEYDYLLESEDGLGFEADFIMIKRDKDLFVFFGYSTIDFYDISYNAYIAMLQSLTFNQD